MHKHLFGGRTPVLLLCSREYDSSYAKIQYALVAGKTKDKGTVTMNDPIVGIKIPDHFLSFVLMHIISSLI